MTDSLRTLPNSVIHNHPQIQCYVTYSVEMALLYTKPAYLNLLQSTDITGWS
jgi:hypothetical protein